MAQKATSRKTPPKEADTFISFSTRLLELISKHLKVILLGFIVIILAGVGWTVVHQMQAQRAEKAAARLREIRPELSQPQKTEENLAALQKLINTYPDTGAALQARLFCAHLLYREKRYAEAAAAYEALRGKDPGLDVLLAESLSFCYAAQGKFPQAAEVLEPLVSNTKLPLHGDLLRRQAFLYEQAGDAARALAKYRQLLEQHPGPEVSAYIREKIQLLEKKPG